MEVQVLGPVEVLTDDGEVVPIGSRNQRVLLSVLASSPGTVVSADHLIEQLWGDDPPPSAIASLRSYVSRLRRLLGEALVGRHSGYRLDAPVDAQRFVDLVRTASAKPSAEALVDLDQAVGLWRGAPFSAEAEAPALQTASTSLERTLHDAQESRARCLADIGRTTEALATAESLLAVSPYREPVWAVLVNALTSAGRKVEALRAAQSARSSLAHAGLDPGAGLLEAEAAALASDAGPVSAGRPVPVQLAAVVGRDEDLDVVTELVRSNRLVTLVGTGGVGKTRLAYEVALRCRDSFARGVVVAELPRLESPEMVADALVDALGLAISVDAEHTLSAAGGLDMLLVVDNCEHVVAEAARLVEVLLGSGTGLHVLATSRERLGSAGERCHVVEPLGVVGPDAAAVELFLERAASASATIDPVDLRHVERIVTRLDGLPLAVEMAAARAATMGVAEIADAVETGLSLLRSERRNQSPRHRTLRAAIEWSERALGPGVRTSLYEMSVFAGPVTADDIRGVLTGSAAFADVLELAERSLVSVESRPDLTRYRLLATVKEYAREQLVAAGHHAEVQRRHARHFVDAAVLADEALTTKGEASADDLFAAVYDEIRSAFFWSRTADLDLAVDLCRALSRWARSRQRFEVFEWASTLLRETEAEPRMGIVAAWLAHHLADRAELAEAESMARRAMELDDDPRVAVVALEAQADVATYRGDLEPALDLSRRVRDLGSRLGDRHAEVLGHLGMCLLRAFVGQSTQARAGLEEVTLSADDPPSIRGWAAYARAEIHRDIDPRGTLHDVELAIALAESVNNAFLAGVARVTRASLLARVGTSAEAAEGFANVIGHWQARNDLVHLVTTLRNVVPYLVRQGEAGGAAELLGAVERQDASPSFGAEAEGLKAAGQALRETVGRKRFAELHRRGARRTMGEAAESVLDVLKQLSGETVSE